MKRLTIRNVKIRTMMITAFLCSVSNISAQETEENDSIFDASSKTFLVVPMISNNPAMDTGFGALGMYFFKAQKDDPLSPPSIVSLYSIYTTNKSYIVAPFGRFFWNEDKNRATFGLGGLRVNNDFNYDQQGNDLRLVFSELRYFITLEYSRKLIGDFYLGALYLGTKTSYKFDQGSDEDNAFTRDFFEQNGITDNFVSSIGLNLSFDNRDYVYYPTNGYTFSVRPKLNADWLGSDNDYVDIDYSFSSFHSLSKNKILAFNLSGGFALGDVPFDGYQNYGIRNSLRGYETGKYKGKNMVAFQSEYRWKFYDKWGMVLFAGTGSVWGNDNTGEEEFERHWLPSGGLGLRFVVSEVKKINLRLDYAIGVDGNQGVYFGVMEAF
jgi:outer membrane protein assembly factor BamA